MQDRIKGWLAIHMQVVNHIQMDPELLLTIEKAAQLCITTFRQNNKVLLCGNGGSAADAQHLAAEFSGRFLKDRPPLYAEAMHVNTSYLTAVSNDYGFDQIFERLLRAKGKRGDLIIGLSTSGNSVNVVRAFETANQLGIHSIALTGASGGRLKSLATVWIGVPSEDVPRIQEAHILIGHLICGLVEEELFRG